MLDTKPADIIPQPIFDHLATLQLPLPGLHSLSFFDPPRNGALQAVIDQATSYRVYAYGLAIADCAGWSNTNGDAASLCWDKEVWFLAALLHDIGWDEEAQRRTRLSFEIWGGITARELLRKWGAPHDVADEVCEAIIRHTEDATKGSARLITALLQVGPTQDFRGVAVPLYVHPEDSNQICERWPRIGLVDHFIVTTQNELSRKPGCISTYWGPRVMHLVKDIACFHGIQGEMSGNEEWAERRKHVQLDF